MNQAIHVPIDLKHYSKYLSYKQNAKGKFIFNPIRKNWVLIQPEEVIRQLFIQYLLHQQKISINRISTEVMIKVNDRIKRYDLGITNPLGEFVFLLECKSFQVKLDTLSFQQIGNYNLELKSKFIGLTNGIQHYFLEIDIENKAYKFLDHFPNLK